MLQRKTRSRSGSVKLGKSSGPRIVTNIRAATKQQIITRHNFYMYEFRTKYCQDFPLFMCKQAKPYTCVKAHYENNIRRRPRLVNGKFNFTDKLCTFASITDCPQSMNCTFSHRVQKEHIYHPSLYKTQLCESPLTEDGICAEFGVHCAKAHGVKDLRQPQYEPDDPRALVQRSGSSSPGCNSDTSGDSKAGEHGFQVSRTFDENTKELKIHADYMYKFRVEQCLSHALGRCQYDGNSCFHSHGEESSRRIPELINGKFNYLPIRCQYMLKGKTCHHARNCRFAHSKEEVIYHPSKYKTQLCPHRLKKVQVIQQPGGVPNQADSSMGGIEGKTKEMWVCAGYGIHCAKAHGKDDLRLPVFENCSKEMPMKPQPPPHYRSVAHPNAQDSIFKPTGLSHRRHSVNGSDVVSASPVYRSMSLTSKNAAGPGGQRATSPRFFSELRHEKTRHRSTEGREYTNRERTWANSRPHSEITFGSEQQARNYRFQQQQNWMKISKPHSAPNKGLDELQRLSLAQRRQNQNFSSPSDSPRLAQKPRSESADQPSIDGFMRDRFHMYQKNNNDAELQAVSNHLLKLGISPSQSQRGLMLNEQECNRLQNDFKKPVGAGRFSSPYSGSSGSGSGRLATYLPSFLVNFVTNE
mmetsp:Transcript_7801/g.11077  ORF Transcript_7801/g.11077 Transcript_7801/m.11077 type:complete len:639 (+) Transcript_7801:160-2076(+)